MLNVVLSCFWNESCILFGAEACMGLWSIRCCIYGEKTCVLIWCCFCAWESQSDSVLAVLERRFFFPCFCRTSWRATREELSFLQQNVCVSYYSEGKKSCKSWCLLIQCYRSAWHCTTSQVFFGCCQITAHVPRYCQYGKNPSCLFSAPLLQTTCVARLKHIHQYDATWILRKTCLWSPQFWKLGCCNSWKGSSSLMGLGSHVHVFHLDKILFSPNLQFHINFIIFFINDLQNIKTPKLTKKSENNKAKGLTNAD